MSTPYTWARAHVILLFEDLARPGREREAAAYCRQMAQEHPEDALDWEREATAYERVAAGLPFALRERAGRSVPQMQTVPAHDDEEDEVL